MNISIIKQLDCSGAARMSQASLQLLSSCRYGRGFSFAKAIRMFILDPSKGIG